MQTPERQNDDTRLIRLEKATDTIDAFIRQKDRDDAVRLAILAERLDVLTTLVKESSLTMNQQIKELKAENQKVRDTTTWFSITWKVIAGILATAGVTVAILKAVRVIP